MHAPSGAQRDFTVLESTIAGLNAGKKGLDAEHESASALLADLDERLLKLKDSATNAERERAALAARKEALEVGLNRKDGAKGTARGQRRSISRMAPGQWLP
ncbi:MAG: hypothetical protein R2709_09065 [Marmoricola sp.]